ncbi:hypothetical protein [Chitinophaga pinensis]|uniref:YCII-related domain-containing protein n=1 Tax=Chitinophaga pinensis (strain ATCC 43595 / DSM 2588 / LMG 13176 / NBRC 15968 / NCIMB 11800 / UQM 2034) TaxID=485918 RepID=A0A979H065_CHIPD|nr:hypothetical protein [Chitinophaga pinensis]ACU64594.1 hypothetical protein Cpin_7194 [Chitinophaga pinensis DSM 2588]
MDYRQPHEVLLFFGKGRNWEQGNKDCLVAQQQYYYQLQLEGKVLRTGLQVHETGLFVSLFVDSDAALFAILEQDPALREEVAEVLQAIPLATGIREAI